MTGLPLNALAEGKQNCIWQHKKHEDKQSSYKERNVLSRKEFKIVAEYPKTFIFSTGISRGGD